MADAQRLQDDARYREVYDLAVRIGLAWREVRRGASAGYVRDFLFGEGDDAIEQGQMDSLDLLADGRAWRMSELADALKVDPSTATRAVQRLVNAGLAERRADPNDGRVVQVSITAAGRAAHDEVSARRAELLGYIVSHFRRSELHQFAEMMERFNASVGSFFTGRLTTQATPSGHR